MSASSNCVTCGMLTQLACSRGPAIFWMRVSGRRSIGPKAAKSTWGTAGSAPPETAAAPVISCLTCALTSSAVIRPLSPVPVTRARSTPSSRANRRTEGPACAREKPGSSMTGDAAASAAGGVTAVAAGRGVVAAAAAGGAGLAAGAGFSAGAAFAAADAAVVAAGSPAPGSTTAITSPFETRSPRLILSSRIVPLAGEGTSKVAFSVSSVINGASVATVSPTLTMTSITSTSLKSPRSGTRISIGPATREPAYTVTGLGLSGSMPNRAIAPRTVPTSRRPSSASAFSAASAI